MKTAIPKIHPGRFDALLQHIDSLFIGTNLSLRLQPLVHPVFTELFSFCYILFFPYLLFSLHLLFLRRRGAVAKICYRPVHDLWNRVSGVLRSFPRPDRYRDGGPIYRAADRLVDHEIQCRDRGAGSNGVDVFPSLHCAVSSFFLFFDRRHRPWRFKLYLRALRRACGSRPFICGTTTSWMFFADLRSRLLRSGLPRRLSAKSGFDQHCRPCARRINHSQFTMNYTCDLPGSAGRPH